MRDKSTVLNIYMSSSGPILSQVTIESRSTTLKSFESSRKSGNKFNNFLHSFEVSNYHLFVICFAKNRKIASFTLKRSFSRLHSMSKDGRKMSSMHVTPKAGVTDSDAG